MTTYVTLYVVGAGVLAIGYILNVYALIIMLIKDVPPSYTLWLARTFGLVFVPLGAALGYMV